MVDSIGSGGSSNSLRSLGDARKNVNKSLERLASGSRLNRAQDDAAGLAIAESLNALSRTTRQADRNISDGVSALQIADGASGQISDILTRQSELATQAANGTLSDEQRSALNTEFQALEQEKVRITETTTFNGQQLFNNNSVSVQAGTDSSSNSQISVPSPNSSGFTISGGIGSQAAAQAALNATSDAVANVASARSEIGAVQSRLDQASETLKSRDVETRAAESRIRDANIAEESASLTANSIREQGATAVLAQSKNLSASIVQKLLT